jgi:hypothetical protein
MAKRTLEVMIDDIDGTELPDGSGECVHFSLDGKDYSIDLSQANAEQFREVLAPYISAGQRLSSNGTSRPRGTSQRASRQGRAQELAAVREWARANGMAVPDRGRIPAAVMDAYAAAN